MSAPPVPPAATVFDPFGVWEAWRRAAAVWNLPLSGDVTESAGQIGFVNIATGSGDPALERRIVEHVASYGRQLGWVVDALDALIRAAQDEPAHAGDATALDKVVALRAEVERVKEETIAERVDRLVADVRALRADPVGNAEALAALRAALDGR
jgi:hypothetical protein